MPDPTVTLARAYSAGVHLASSAEIAGEPEAQLTTPVANLFCGIAQCFGIGNLQSIRESRRDRIRPDFAFLLDGRHIGYGELKKPSVPVDVTSRTGWTRNQRLYLSELDSLLVCNGREAQLYSGGEPVGSVASLPYDDPENWNPRGLVALLERLSHLRPRSVTSIKDLAERLARRTAGLRDRILDLLEDVPPSPQSAVLEARDALNAWQTYVNPSSKPRDFADGVSQVVAYGLVMAALEGLADSNNDGRITAEEARDWLRSNNPVISASFGPLLGMPALAVAVRSAIAAIEDLCSAIDPEKVRRSSDRRGEPWLYFYEDFLAIYDPAERKQAGVYYTPVDIVHAMVQVCEYILTHRFARRLGFADSSVVTLDPATGTGTFPLAILASAAATARSERGASGPSQAARQLARNLVAFELLPGPYGVAHLRISERLRMLNPSLDERPSVVLTDTLESPTGLDPQLGLWGDQRVMAEEQSRARRIKSEQPVTVVIGNPPYRRVDKTGSGRGGGGWVLNGPVPGRLDIDQSLFDDILDVAKRETVFSHHASLYNLYVYFWRWAIWKAFEAHGPGPAIVAFITGRSWLHGPGFVGLRQLVRQVADEGWIFDLGGDNKAAIAEENVFAIETPVAIVVLVRDGEGDIKSPSKMHYRRVRGSRADKLQEMEAIADSAEPLAGTWEEVPTGWTDPLVPDTGTLEWDSMPALTDLMPWQQPGCKFNRLWPIAPTRDTLQRRWQRFVSSPTERTRATQIAKGIDPGPSRETLFQTANSGRDIDTAVVGLPALASLRADAPSRPIVRYGYRSFDRQWAFDDPRMAKTDSPALWQSVSEHQIFLATITSKSFGLGPCLTVSDCVPDLHYFCGRGGKDIIPLYRDRLRSRPNVTAGLLERLGLLLARPQPSPEDLAAYLYALLSTPAYQQRFASELQSLGSRVPMTRDPQLWDAAVAKGRLLLWLHTYGQRFQNTTIGRGMRVPAVAGLEWRTPVNTAPASSSSISYDESKSLLHVGDGEVDGVRPEVWRFEVSGMPVVQKWLGYRTLSGAGRSLSSTNPLDKIRPGEWADEWNDELLDLLRVLTLTVEQYPDQNVLLEQICCGPQIRVDELPVPSDAERKPPATERRFEPRLLD